MRKVRALGVFWYDFVVGDDWRVAVTVAVALAVTVAVDRMSGSAPWWILLAAVVVALPASIYRVTHGRPPTDR